MEVDQLCLEDEQEDDENRRIKRFVETTILAVTAA
jgi:hypothetical protein